VGVCQDPAASTTSSFTFAYDVLNTVIWLPTGSRRLRHQFVAGLAVRPGSRVLELGCGTGQVTAGLAANGAKVVAVDRSSTMLDAARRRAPSAEFVKGDVVDRDTEGGFDVVVLAFVLHELDDAAARVEALARARDALAPDGCIGILEWSLPRDGWRRSAWRRLIAIIEPNGASDVLADCLPDDVHSAGLVVTQTRSLAGGRASMMLAARR
jgi:ubiquinone/menaquinone biosynthesis C-methylase UbiE